MNKVGWWVWVRCADPLAHIFHISRSMDLYLLTTRFCYSRVHRPHLLSFTFSLLEQPKHEKFVGCSLFSHSLLFIDKLLYTFRLYFDFVANGINRICVICLTIITVTTYDLICCCYTKNDWFYLFAQQQDNKKCVFTPFLILGHRKKGP